MENMILWCFYILTFYAFLPGIVSRIFGFRVFKRGKSERELCLTFDDGPDAHYTLLLLDLLKKYEAKATFFVVGVNAEKHPDIIKRIHDEGHLIGIHNYVHKSNWLMRPRTVKRQIKKTLDIIHKITGQKTVYYRPPWGIVNLFDFTSLGYLHIILWSAMFGDWRKRVGAERLERRMMKKLRGGEVLLLHDCGTTFGADPDAPANMLIALERFLQAAQAKDLRCIRIDEMIETTDQSLSHSRSQASRMKPGKKMLVKLWLAWERCFHVLFRLKKTSDPDPSMYYRITRYHGQDVTMRDGRVLTKGDPVMELHFDNKKMYEMGMKSRSTMQVAIQVIRMVEKSLPYFAEQLISKPELAKVKALFGITMIHRGSEKFGFNVLDLPKGLFARLTKMYLKILLFVIHPNGQARLKDRSHELVPKRLVLSSEIVKERYAVPSAPNNEQKPIQAEEQLILPLPGAQSKLL